MSAPIYTVAALRAQLVTIRALELELDAHYASRPSDPQVLSAEQWQERMAKRDDIAHRLEGERRLFVRVVATMLDGNMLADAPPIPPGSSRRHQR